MLTKTPELQVCICSGFSPSVDLEIHSVFIIPLTIGTGVGEDIKHPTIEFSFIHSFTHTLWSINLLALAMLAGAQVDNVIHLDNKNHMCCE